MARKDRPIAAMRDLQRLVPAIVKELNADPQLALRAAANPLLALEELGYDLTPALRVEAERRIRFSPETIAHLDTLAAQVFAAADAHFDLDSPAEVEHTLFDKLGLARPAPAQPASHKQRQSTDYALSESPIAPLPVSGTPAFTDPLEVLRTAHPIMEPLLEYRQVAASQPQLAPPGLYEQIKHGNIKLPVTRIHFRLQRGPTPE